MAGFVPGRHAKSILLIETSQLVVSFSFVSAYPYPYPAWYIDKEYGFVHETYINKPLFTLGKFEPISSDEIRAAPHKKINLLNFSVG